MPTNFPFYQQALLALFGSPDTRQGLQNLFGVLRCHMPVEAITFERLHSNGEALYVHFIITKRGTFSLNHHLPLRHGDKEYLQACRKQRVILRCNHNASGIDLGLRHLQKLVHHLPLRERGYMVAMLEANAQPVGYLSLWGRAAGCFSAEHTQLLEMLMPACAPAIAHMLHLGDARKQEAHLRIERERLQREVGLLTHTEMAGAQGGLRQVMEAVHQLAHKDTPVLILGETGTGKELVANALQKHSTRSGKAFVKVNCGALTDTLLDSELFGHERGAFTGAFNMRAGRFEQADGGTLFLDEVGELSPQGQVRLLRVLQDGIVERMGGRRHITVDVRIIAATNRDLRAMCRQGLFREDLYHRLNVFPIHMPPLRQRREDIPLLISFLAERIATRLGLAVPTIHMHHMDKLMRYAWPGNVRELENLVERALIVQPHGPLDISPFVPLEAETQAEGAEDNLGAGPDSALKAKFEEWLAHRQQDAPARRSAPAGLQQDVSSDKAPTQPLLPSARTTMPPGTELAGDEAAMHARIREALVLCNGKVYGPGGAAEMLALNHNTLRSRMRKLGIEAAAARRRPV